MYGHQTKGTGESESETKIYEPLHQHVLRRSVFRQPNPRISSLPETLIPRKPFQIRRNHVIAHYTMTIPTPTSSLIPPILSPIPHIPLAPPHSEYCLTTHLPTDVNHLPRICDQPKFQATFGYAHEHMTLELAKEWLDMVGEKTQGFPFNGETHSMYPLSFLLYLFDLRIRVDVG